MVKMAQGAKFQPGLISDEDIAELLDHAPNGLAILSSTAEFQVVYVNPEFTRLFGYQKDDVKSVSDWAELAYPDAALRQQNLASWSAAVKQARLDHQPIPDRQASIRCKDGTFREVILQTSLLRHLLLISLTDITERKRLENELLEREKQFRSFVDDAGRDINLRKQAEEKLRLSEARYRLLSDNARDVIWTIAPDGTITYVSPSVEQVRGYTPQEAMNQALEQHLIPDSIALNLAYFGQLLTDVAAGRQPQTFRGQMEYLCKDGSTYWCDVMATPILADDGSLVELLGVSRDISEHKRFADELKQAKEATEALNRALESANERLSRMATSDTLTGLWNRRYFDERVAHEMVVANRYGQPLSMLIFDIDHFKLVNDTHGHLVGDHVLVELSNIARQQIRAADLLFRWGGEEFMILMPGTGEPEAMIAAEKLRTTFASHPIAEVGKVSASFGIATYLPNESLDNWISRADAALYEAKTSGRNTVRLAANW